MNISVLGIDLAKNVFQLHGTDKHGRCVLRKRLSRSKLPEFISKLPRCLIGLEACGGAHYWARTFKSYGHEVKMMAPQFVKPYVKSNKSDRNDSEAIAEAVIRPNMRFVGIKTMEQQDILLVHRCRELAIKQRIALSNQIRGLLAEYGVVLPKGNESIIHLPETLDMNTNKLTSIAIEMFIELQKQYKAYNEQIARYNTIIISQANRDPICNEIQKIEGIGPITASAIVATIGDAKVFKKGREVAAWLGLVPKQCSSGNRIVLGGISKRGDRWGVTIIGMKRYSKDFN